MLSHVLGNDSGEAKHSGFVRRLIMENLRIVILSDASPRLLWRLAQRLQNEVSGVTICGLIHDAGSQHDARGRTGERIRAGLSHLANLLLRWGHACPSDPNVSAQFTRNTLVQHSHKAGWGVACVDGANFRPALDLVHELRPDLSLALVSESPARTLLAMPRLGSVVVTRARRPLRSGGVSVEIPTEIKITASRLHGTGEQTCIRVLSLPIEPYDTATSMALKADLVGSDLLTESAASIVQDEGLAGSQAGCGAQLLSYLSHCQRRKTGELSASRAFLGTRPLWKSIFILLLLSPFIVVRNWYRRWRGRFPVIILAHHLIADVPHHLGMPTAMFLRIVEFLQTYYRIVSLSEAVELLRSGSVKIPTVALTFDDGYQVNFLSLRSVTEATGIPVSLFVCTGFLEQTPLPHDQRRGQLSFPTLNGEQLGYLARNGVEIGSHTRTHFDCGTGDRVVLEEEIMGAKSDLQQRLGQRVRFFAFPFGKPRNISTIAMQLARSNYEYVLSCFGGENVTQAGCETHLLRKNLESDVWSLELTLQGVLDLHWNLKRILGWGEEAHEIQRVQALGRKALVHACGGEMNLGENN